MKRAFGVILIILGAALILSSFYVKNRVLEGKESIKRAEKTVNTGKELFSLNPVTKEVGKELTKGADEKIDQGKMQVGYYSNVAYWLKIVGIIFIVLGILFVFFGKKKTVLPPQ